MKQASETAKYGAFDALCPMHVQIDMTTGIVVHVGPTFEKLRPGKLIGRHFTEVLLVTQPRSVRTADQLNALRGQKMHIQLTDNPKTKFKGTCARGAFNTIINLSFGINLMEAVQTYDLNNSDFAGTDLAIEMLYLIEAKNAALSEGRNLNHRLSEANQLAEIRANSDALTGLANRRAMTSVLENWITNGQDFACMQLDLDYFKAVNDTYGHAAGDQILTQVAKILKSETRSGDCVARIGGDEFAILFADLTDNDLLDKIARRIIDKLEVPVNYKGNICKISGSAGTTISSKYDNPNADVLLNDADVALYASKNAGRGRHLFFTPKMAA